MNPASISFETWSSISAEVEGKGRDALFDRLEAEGIDPADYEVAAARHLVAIAAALAAGDASLAAAHAARCAGADRAANDSATEGSDAQALETTQDPASESTRDKTLPFEKSGGLASRAPPPTSLQDRSGVTSALSAGFVAAPSTPFERARLEAWTVERYAAFVADRRRHTPDLIEARYGPLTERDEVALLVHFNHRFRSEPGLRARWQRLVAAHERKG